MVVIVVNILYALGGFNARGGFKIRYEKFAMFKLK